MATPIRRLILPAFAFVMLAGGTSVSAQTTGMVEFFDAGKIRKGLALVEFAQEMVVIGRDGWMHSLNPKNPKSQIRRLDERYQPISVTDLRNELRAEFGRNFEVVATQNFLVVQPRGRGDRWPKLFEQSHRGFSDYMKKRGVELRQGRFPMVAVVFPDQNAMFDEFKRLDIDVTRVAGIYSGESNRVMTHDGGRSSSIAATVRHEAAHQSAFNSGVHSRVNDTPRWISEGVGQMFEPRGMTNARMATRLTDRVNHESLGFVKSRFPDRRDARFAETVTQLIGGDQRFQNEKQIDEAYAVSWAMMFYLAERQPKEFAALLNHTAKRPPFRAYERLDRIGDFEKIVGVDTIEFSQRVMWFLQSL